MASTNLTPVDWAKKPIENYAKFDGRAPRAEYWWYTLGLIIAYVVLNIIEGILGLGGMIGGAYGPLTLLLWLGTLVPSIAVTIRRLHDTDRSGWWILLPIVPYVIGFALAGPAMMGGSMTGMGIAGIFLLIGMGCAIALLVFMILPSTPGDNRYGPNPYGEGSSATAG